MYHVLRRTNRNQAGNRTVRFEGEPFGANVSFFLVDNEPGEGPDLHIHPYPETWIVNDGEAELTIGTEKARASTGDIVTAPAGVPHRFENVGTGRLKITCIHPSDRIVQEWVAQPAAA